MIRLPKLLLGEHLDRLLDLADEIGRSEAETVQCDASEMITAEPVGLCLLAATLERAKRLGQEIVLHSIRPDVRRYLEQRNILSEWIRESTSRVPQRRASDVSPAIQTERVTSHKEANAVANAITQAIAHFIPSEDLLGVLDEDEELRRYRLIERPIGYLFSEFLENALTHARNGGFVHASAWIAGQYYPRGDLVRVCVLDDGCGFLRSLRDHEQVNPKTDLVAVQKAFLPYVSSRREVGLFKDAANMGLGLTVCRDICMKSGGQIDVVTGSAWIRNPGCATESVRRLQRRYQGAILNLNLHRRSLTAGMLSEILARYEPKEDLPIRFV